jgi:hypothetical protein
MTTEYRIWTPVAAPGICRLSSMLGYDEPWDLIRGRPLQTKLPKDVRYPMNASRPRDTKLADTLANINLALVVSKRLAEFLQEKKVPGLEYIQVRIINHKGKVASPDYVLVNILALQDCLDLARSKPTYNHIVKVEIDWVEQLVFNENRIDPALPLFRIKNYYRHIIIEAKLAAEIEEQGFTGFAMLTFDEFEP